MEIAHGLFTWQDGRTALEASLRSTAGYVDHLLIADGLIQGVDAGGLPPFSDFSWLDANHGHDWLPAEIPTSARPWPTLSEACTWLLRTARSLGCEWLLFVDADQELHNAAALRDHLEGWRGQVAYPIARADPGGLHACPWQCVRVPAISHYVAGCFVVELTDGQVVSLVPAGPSPPVLNAHAPWISHHPERRPPGRQSHRLGNLETVLEPPPPGVPTLHLPSHLIGSRAMGEASHYCDQCGERYDGPGVCDNGHPAAEITKLKAAAAKAEPKTTANTSTTKKK